MLMLKNQSAWGPAMKLFNVFLGCLLLAGNANAYNVVIDFEELTPVAPFHIGPPIETRGFNFNGGGVTDWSYFEAGTTQALHWCPNCDYISMTQDGLAAFDLLSVDLAYSDYADEAHLVGTFVGGGSISTFVNVTSTMTTFSLGAGWTNLQRLEIYGGGQPHIGAIAADNIAVVTAVPVPAAVWLFGSALAGLGWIRRKLSA